MRREPAGRSLALRSPRHSATARLAVVSLLLGAGMALLGLVATDPSEVPATLDEETAPGAIPPAAEGATDAP